MIYTITTLGDNSAHPRFPRCAGYYLTQGDAEHTLKKNYGGLSEGGYYTHAVIEEIGMGLYFPAKQVSWWAWVVDEWVKIEQPEVYKKVGNFARG